MLTSPLNAVCVWQVNAPVVWHPPDSLTIHLVGCAISRLSNKNALMVVSFGLTRPYTSQVLAIGDRYKF